MTVRLAARARQKKAAPVASCPAGLRHEEHPGHTDRGRRQRPLAWQLHVSRQARPCKAAPGHVSRVTGGAGAVPGWPHPSSVLNGEFCFERIGTIEVWVARRVPLRTTIARACRSHDTMVGVTDVISTLARFSRAPGSARAVCLAPCLGLRHAQVGHTQHPGMQKLGRSKNSSILSDRGTIQMTSIFSGGAFDAVCLQ